MFRDVNFRITFESLSQIRIYQSVARAESSRSDFPGALGSNAPATLSILRSSRVFDDLYIFVLLFLFSPLFLSFVGNMNR